MGVASHPIRKTPIRETVLITVRRSISLNGDAIFNIRVNINSFLLPDIFKLQQTYT